jgi:hypothetical protein
MLIGSNVNPYKKLLEDDSSEDNEQEEYLVTLLKDLIQSYDYLFEDQTSVEIQEATNNPIKEYTRIFEVLNTFEVDYKSTIEKILKEFPQLENRQQKNPNFLVKLLIEFEEENGFDNIDKDNFSLDDDIKIGYLMCYINGSLYLDSYQKATRYYFDKYNKRYYPSYREEISIKKLLQTLDKEYVENNYEDLVDSDNFSTVDTKILNELNCKESIIDALNSSSLDLIFNDIEFVAYADKLEKVYSDFVVYVDAEEFFLEFRRYLLNNTSVLGIKSEDNTVWEDLEEEE